MGRARQALGGLLAVVAGIATIGGGCGPFQYQEGPGGAAAGVGGGAGGDAGAGAGGQAGSGASGGTGGSGGGGTVCTPGEVRWCPYDGPPGTEGIGACKAGHRTCNDDGTAFGSCEGEVPPGDKEIPGDMIDDNCDGTALTGGESVLARYFINEDPGESVIHDAVQPPVDLDVLNPDVTALSVFEDASGHRGLHWTASGTTSRASAVITNTKIQSTLGELTAVTMEVVADLEAVVSWTRFVFIGHLDGTSGIDDLSFLFEASRTRFYLADAESGRWNFDPALTGRVVMHLVLATNEPTPEDRAKLYVNGQRVPGDGGSRPGSGQPINVSASEYLSLGTRPGGNFSPQGTIYYAAIYTAALSELEIQTNASLLLLDDDHP